MAIAHRRSAAATLTLLVGVALSGCQRTNGENAAAANMNGNQALTANPNAMGSSGLPPTENTSPGNNSINKGAVGNGMVPP